MAAKMIFAGFGGLPQIWGQPPPVPLVATCLGDSDPGALINREVGCYLRETEMLGQSNDI